MKVCVAQTKPFKGDIAKNIASHKILIALAVSNGADIIVFPELSLTGYEPDLASIVATNQDDNIFDGFQEISDSNQITIGVGMPTKSSTGIQISMIILQPGNPRQTYSKQYLHKDEFPFFVKGDQQLLISIHDTLIAPAICYESLVPEHAENVSIMGSAIYITSVAKTMNGVEKAFRHYPEIARKYSMTVFMSNCVGHCDNFDSAGNTAIWNDKGSLVGQLDGSNEGILLFDTETQKLIQKSI